MRTIILPRNPETAIRGHVLLWVLLTLLGTAARSMAQEARPRPRIGIALSGGGVLGMSHIGVIKWFEAHHIPIDCVSGTSMGGLVGGFYATGLSAEEIRALLLPMNWEEALASDTPFTQLSFRRKEDRRAVPTRLNAGLRRGIALPSGLMPAHPVGMLLSRVGSPYADLSSFDDLPTPFRCMGVDLETGTLHTLKDGSLVTAMRATMAVPGFFTPLQRDNKTLVDAGLLNNMPTEALKTMNPDILIAVELYAPPDQMFGAQSFADNFSKMLIFAGDKNASRSLKLADIVLTSDISGQSIADFDHLDRLIERGYRAAEARSAILLRLALNDADWKDYVAQRRSRCRLAPAAPAFVVVEGESGREKERLAKRLQSLVGAPPNTGTWEKELTAITGEGRYESMLYERVQRDGKPGLRVLAQKKKYGSPFLKLGIAVNGADTDNIHFNTMARLLALDVGAPDAEVRADLRLGTDRDLAVEYYRPLSGSRAFLAPRLFYTDGTQSQFIQGFRSAIYGTRSLGAALDLGYRTGRLSELRMGYQASHLRSSVRTGSPLLPSLSGGVSVLSLRWAYDGQDSENIPTRGTRINTEGCWYLSDPGAPKAFPKIDFRLSSFHPMGSRNSLFVTGGIGTTFGGKAGPLQQFTLGGPLRLGAYGSEEYRGNAYAYASLGYLHRIGTLPGFLGGKILLGSWYEIGGAFPRLDHARYRSDISFGIIAETLLGPVMVGGSVGESGRSSAYFALGRLF